MLAMQHKQKNGETLLARSKGKEDARKEKQRILKG